MLLLFWTHDGEVAYTEFCMPVVATQPEKAPSSYTLEIYVTGYLDIHRETAFVGVFGAHKVLLATLVNVYSPQEIIHTCGGHHDRWSLAAMETMIPS